MAKILGRFSLAHSGVHAVDLVALRPCHDSINLGARYYRPNLVPSPRVIIDAGKRFDNSDGTSRSLALQRDRQLRDL